MKYWEGTRIPRQNPQPEIPQDNQIWIFRSVDDGKTYRLQLEQIGSLGPAMDTLSKEAEK